MFFLTLCLLFIMTQERCHHNSDHIVTKEQELSLLIQNCLKYLYITHEKEEDSHNFGTII